MSSTTPVPQRRTADVEWQRAGTRTDTALPVSTPVVEALLDRLPVLPSGSVVLDLACGDGQPAFVLARKRPGVDVLGVDLAPALIAQARIKARAHAVTNVRFEVMSLDHLDLADRSVNAVVSHFGLLQEGDIVASAGELARVLTPGAPFSFAVFDDMALNTLMSTIAQTLAGHVPPDTLPDFAYLTELAAPGLREQVLREAGLEHLHADLFRWSVQLPSFDLVWQIATSTVPFTALNGVGTRRVRSRLRDVATSPTPFARAFASLDSVGRRRVRSELRDAVTPYQTVSGAFVFPTACRLFQGHT